MPRIAILERQRVYDHLNGLFDYPVTIVSATMGYGKTTAMRAYLSQRGVRTIWVSPLGQDGAAETFWRRLIKATQATHPAVGRELEKLGFPADAEQTAAFLDVLWGLEDGVPTVVVIDDYHLIEQSSRSGRLVELVAKEGIPGLHVVLLTRNRPRFSHIELLSKGLCLYLDTGTLAFTAEEVADYLALTGREVTAESVQRIHRYTGGWISAIYLLVLGLQRGLPVNEVSNINQLVHDNLFTLLSDQDKQLLLALAVLDSFTLAQAQAVLAHQGVPQLLAQLVEQNAFIEYDGQNGIYQLHHVLLDFLRDIQPISGVDLRPIYHRAGQWFFRQGEIIAAFDYYHRAGMIEELLAELNQPGSTDISYLGYRLFQRLFCSSFHELCIRYPFPFLQIACDLIVSNDETAVRQGVETVKIMQAHFRSDSSLPEGLRGRILGELEVLEIFLVFNDPQAMVDHADRAAALLAGEMSSVILRHHEFTFGLPHFLYTYYREPGSLQATVDCLTSGFPPGVFDGCGTGCGYLAQAEQSLETGKLAQVAALAQKAIYQAESMQQVSIILCARFVLMRLALLEGRPNQAIAELAQTRTWLAGCQPELTPLGRAIYGTTLDMCEGYLYGVLRRQPQIPDWLASGNLAAGTFMLRGLGFPSIVHGQALLAAHEWEKLEALTERWQADFLLFHNQLGLLHNAIHAAAAKWHQGNLQAATTALLPALEQASLDGIVAPFLENADHLLPVMSSLRGRTRYEEYLQRLTALCKKQQQLLATWGDAPVRLTPREVEVLHLLKRGLTQRDIAGELCVSVAGVKKHLENIYAKLGVNNKTSAMNRARELKLSKD